MQCPSDAVQTVCEVAAGLKDGSKPVPRNNFLPSGAQKPRSQMIKSECLAYSLFCVFIFGFMAYRENGHPLFFPKADLQCQGKANLY